MSWLLVRSPSRSKAGWQWPPRGQGVENPARRPWVHLGDGTPADVIATAGTYELHIPQNSGSVTGGGPSYEYQPYTPNWGLELRIWNPTGVVAGRFGVTLTDSWTAVGLGAAFDRVISIGLFHRIPAAGGDLIQIQEFSSMMSVATTLLEVPSPVMFNSGYLRLKIWCDDDQYIRVWLNDIYCGAADIIPDYKLGPGRRAVRFLNTNANDVWVSNANGGEGKPALWHYDRSNNRAINDITFPDSSVFNTVVFSDDFTSPSGWTQLGSNAGFSGGVWKTTGTTDGSRGLIRPSGITTGRMRVEAVMGSAGNNTADSSIVLCTNAAGDQGLALNCFGSKAYLSRFSSSLGGSSVTMNDFTPMPNGILLEAGDTLALNIWDGALWAEQKKAGQSTWTRFLHAAVGVHDVVPKTNDRYGLRVERASFNDSNSWDSIRLLTAA